VNNDLRIHRTRRSSPDNSGTYTIRRVRIPPCDAGKRIRAIRLPTAIVLFDGKDLSHWSPSSISPEKGVTLKPGAAPWKVGMATLKSWLEARYCDEGKFGDVQLHVEFANPAEIRGSSQSRGKQRYLHAGPL